MKKGTVKWFDRVKSYGFITPAEGGKDIFVHSSGLNGGTIREGDNVTYELKDGPKGLNAVNVTVEEVEA